MKTTTSIEYARHLHDIEGGYLLDLGPECETIANRHGACPRHTGKHVYVVTDSPELYGRTAAQISSLDADGWSEA